MITLGLYLGLPGILADIEDAPAVGAYVPTIEGYAIIIQGYLITIT